MHHNCHDAMCSLCLPRARREVCAHYRDCLTVEPCLEACCVKLVNFSYSPGGCPSYMLDFDLYPYIGQRVTIAVCRLRVSISRFDGEVRTVEFRQLRSYPVPRHLWDLVKQPF